ncbi:hypothetical protein [Thioclava sp.]|uniref:hypothetical protein n=1 Tax=Thioclava sp. TaxID=1933450 RepID=UPI003AA8C6D5
MKVKNISLIDGQFVYAGIITDTGIINVEAEISSIIPIHIESAVWKATGEDASCYIAQHFDAVRGLITQELAQMAE